jgi:hypothetical protein
MRKEASFGTTTRRRQRTPGIPLLGLMLAVLLGIVSYFVAPALLDFVSDQVPDFGQQIDDWPGAKPYDWLPDALPDYLAGVALWLIMMGVAMFFASAMVGQDPEREGWQHMGPPPANKKKVLKQLRKDLKVAQQREREMEREAKKRKKA